MNEPDTAALEAEALRSIITPGEKRGVVEGAELLDVYDHEVEAIIGLQVRITTAWQDRLLTCPPLAWATTIARFEHEVAEQFAEIGFVASVEMMANPDLGGMMCPTIQVTGRTEAIDFDPDRQVHEVTHDLLGLGEEHSAVIDTSKMTPEQMAKARHHHDEGWHE